MQSKNADFFNGQYNYACMVGNDLIKMMQKTHLIGSLIILLTIAAGGWSSQMNAAGSDAAENDTAGPESGTGPLDGMNFIGALGPDGKPKDVKDSFVFENGTFVSKECELRCEYPARPYFVRQNGTKTEFISETKCPYKDAKIIWRGTVEGDTIKGKSTWVVKRWYWTVENTFEFEGKLAESSSSTASSD